MKTLAFLSLVLCSSPLAQDRTPAELVAEAREGAAALVELGYAGLAHEIQAAVEAVEARPRDRAGRELAALQAAAEVMAESGALEVSAMISRQHLARTHVREGNLDLALEVLVDGPNLGETLNYLEAAAGHCSRTEDPRAAVILTGAKTLHKEWERHVGIRMADDVQRVVVAARAFGLDQQATEIERYQDKPRRAADQHRLAARTGEVLAQLDDDASEDWQELATRQRHHAYALQQAVGRHKTMQDLELVRLAGEVFEQDGVSRAQRDRYAEALRALEARAAEMPGARAPVDGVMIDLFEDAAPYFGSKGETQIAASFDRAAKIRRAEAERDAKQRAVRRSRSEERSQNIQAWRQRLADGGDEALREAVVSALGQAGTAFDAVGDEQSAVTAMGARRALNRSRLGEPGAPAVEEIVDHLRRGAVLTSGSLRANQMRELANRLETRPPAPTAPVRSPEELLERIEELENELQGLRRDLGDR